MIVSFILLTSIEVLKQELSISLMSLVPFNTYFQDTLSKWKTKALKIQFTANQGPSKSVQQVHHSRCITFAVRSKWAVRLVRCSDCSVKTNCSDTMRCSVLFAVRIVQVHRSVRCSGRSSNFEIFAVRCSVNPAGKMMTCRCFNFVFW